MLKPFLGVHICVKITTHACLVLTVYHLYNIIHSVTLQLYKTNMSSQAQIDGINEWITRCQHSFVLLSFSTQIFLVLFAKICHLAFSRKWNPFYDSYKSLDEIKQRKVLIYIASILFRCPAAILSLYLTFEYWTLKDGFVVDDCRWVQIIQLISVSYSMLMSFELIKLPEMNWYMWIHHLIVMVIACSIMDQSIFNLSFRTDPYYVEITISLVIGGSLMPTHQIFWVYFHLVELHGPTLAAIKHIDTDRLIQNMENGCGDDNRSTTISTHVQQQQQTSSDCDVDSPSIEYQIKQLSLENLHINCKSLQVKVKILKLRQIVTMSLILSFFGVIPFGLYFTRLSNNSYQKQETKWFILAIISLNIMVEIYVVSVLRAIRQGQLNKCHKHDLVLKSLTQIRFDDIQVNESISQLDKHSM